MKSPKDLTGQKFNKLTVTGFSHYRVLPSGRKVAYWDCVCDCGSKKTVAVNNLTSGEVKSCGCLSSEVSRELMIKIHKNHPGGIALKHGLKHTRLYGVWSNMRNRCYVKSNSHYGSYGGRGIKVCDEWQEFRPFYEWAMANGYNPNAKHFECTIDRIDVNGDYSPSNCRFVTMKEQAKNTRRNVQLTLNGDTRCLAEWSKIIGINPRTLYSRYNLGWSDEAILTQPVRPGIALKKRGEAHA